MKILLAACDIFNTHYDDILQNLPTGFAQLNKGRASNPVHVDLITPLSDAEVEINTRRNINLSVISELQVSFGGKLNNFKVIRAQKDNINHYYISHPALLSSKLGRVFINELYPEASVVGWEVYLYVFLSLCIVEFVSSGFNTYNLINVIGSELGLLPLLLRDRFTSDSPSCVFTFLNIKDEISAPSTLALNIKELPINSSVVSLDTSDNDINFMLEAVAHSDFISTVSKSYAKKLPITELKPDLALILQARSDRIIGVNLGFNYMGINSGFNSTDVTQKKDQFKSKLLKNLGLISQPESSTALYIYNLQEVPRKQTLVHKLLTSLPKVAGIHLIITDLSTYAKNSKLFNSQNTRCIILSGGNNLHHMSRIKFNFLEVLRAADFFVLFDKEPLNSNIIALTNYFGVLPISVLGGVAGDLIKDGVNGVVFSSYTLGALVKALDRSVVLYNNRDQWPQNLQNVANLRQLWSDTASKYLEIYDKACQLKEHQKSGL
ncbi:glycogen/starch synthase [candidate division WWE3 bacterium]|nr:glycogen/starch synthase [candidate division WWE3 bacterium]